MNTISYCFQKKTTLGVGDIYIYIIITSTVIEINYFQFSTFYFILHQ